MTVYVDDFRIPAKVGRYRSRWSHLLCDGGDDELHEFAQRIGLRRSWFQHVSKMTGKEMPWWHRHYDVTDSKRREAIAAGAVPIGFREWREHVLAKRALLEAELGTDRPDVGSGDA